jgi:hypothetical protein
MATPDLSRAYWREMRRRAVRLPDDRLDWAETVFGFVLFVGFLARAFGRDTAVEELKTTAMYLLAAAFTGGVFIMLRLGRAAFDIHVKTFPPSPKLNASVMTLSNA